MKNTKFLVFGVLLSFLLAPVHVFAQETANFEDCSSGSANVASALVKLPKGEFNAYVRAERKEDSGGARVVVQNTDGGPCETIGSSSAQLGRWTNVGKLNNQTDDSLLAVYMLLDAANDTSAGASAPSLMLTDSATMPCEPTENCSVTFQSETFNLEPQKISMATDSLKVGLLKSIDSAGIKQVTYSVDGKPVYIKETLEPFNNNFVSAGEHDLTRTVILDDGQALSETKKLARSEVGDVRYIAISWIYLNARLLKFVGYILGGLILFIIFLIIYRHIHKKRLWKRQHVAASVPVPQGPVNNVPTVFVQPTLESDEESYWELTKRFKKPIIIIGSSLTLFMLVITFAVSIFTVDGVSMMPTLTDRSRKGLLVLPKTVAAFNRNDYVPARGTIVVVKKDENNLFNEAQEQPTYVVKRVIGLPGERVVVKDGVIRVFSQDRPAGFVPDDEFKWVTDLTGSEYFKIDITLKTGEVFVVGDNRDESIDSRFYGPIHAEQIVGKVF